MSRTIEAVYVRGMFQPQSKVDLQENAKVRLVYDEIPQAPARAKDAWDMLESLAGSVDAPADWSTEHDHYLYGAPKREDST